MLHSNEWQRFLLIYGIEIILILHLQFLFAVVSFAVYAAIAERRHFSQEQEFSHAYDRHQLIYFGQSDARVNSSPPVLPALNFELSLDTAYFQKAFCIFHLKWVDCHLMLNNGLFYCNLKMFDWVRLSKYLLLRIFRCPDRPLRSFCDQVRSRGHRCRWDPSPNSTSTILTSLTQKWKLTTNFAQQIYQDCCMKSMVSWRAYRRSNRPERNLAG